MRLLRVEVFDSRPCESKFSRRATGQGGKKTQKMNTLSIVHVDFESQMPYLLSGRPRARVLIVERNYGFYD